MYITFIRPIYLFFVFVIPIFFLVHLITLRKSKRRALRFANFEAIARIRGIDFFSKNIVILVLSVIIILLLVLALAGMTLHFERNASSFSFVIAVDVSQSMEAEDLSPSRIDAAKETAKNFVDFSPFSTRMGVVSFSGTTVIEQEVTDKKELVKSAIDELWLSNFGGTDIYEAIIISTNLLKNEENKAIIILSDGQVNINGINEGIEYANDNDVIINTIAIGTKQGGITSYGISKLDEDSLKSIAYNTQGQYFNAEDKEALSESFNSIMGITMRKVSLEMSYYLIILSIILFSVEYLLINTRYKSIP